MRKPALRKQTQISFAITREADQRLVFATRKVQSIYFLNPKFQASSLLLWQYSPLCVGPGQKPRRPVFSQQGSFDNRSLTPRSFHSGKRLVFCVLFSMSKNQKHYILFLLVIYSSKNLRTSTYVFPLFNTESLIFKIENIF